MCLQCHVKHQHLRQPLMNGAVFRWTERKRLFHARCADAFITKRIDGIYRHGDVMLHYYHQRLP